MSHDTPDLPDDVQAVLDMVRDSALRLLSAFPRPPSVLRVQAGGVVVEAEWPVASTPSGTVVPATAIASADAGAAALDNAVDGSPIENNSLHYLRAPAVGVFFQAPEPGAKPFVDVGDTVFSGQQVAIVEIMKLMIPVHADIDGQIVAVLKANGEAVEYDEPLFTVTSLEQQATGSSRQGLLPQS
ncbi:MAG: acetyl-CoA carboxylase biotin carboxyl carrier protein [Pseudonocardia sp.]